MSSSRFDLGGSVAVVVGGSGVLGGALAMGLAEAGAAVAVLGRDAARCASRVAAIRAAGGRAQAVICDAGDRAALVAAATTIAAELGEPTIMVNAAGGNDPKVTVTAERKFEDLNLDDWMDGYTRNLVAGCLLPCQVFGPRFAAQGGGSIINIASVAAHVPLSRVVCYAQAKAAVLNMTRFLAREWATQGVRVNSITPGFFPAEQNRSLLFQPDGAPTARTQAILGHTPMGRFGSDDELIGACVFLAARRASGFVTGEDIRVDGGFLAQTI